MMLWHSDGSATYALMTYHIYIDISLQTDSQVNSLVLAIIYVGESDLSMQLLATMAAVGTLILGPPSTGHLPQSHAAPHYHTKAFLLMLPLQHAFRVTHGFVKGDGAGSSISPNLA